jgi:CubicO group peptidase (beta-lactamase class C family)
MDSIFLKSEAGRMAALVAALALGPVSAEAPIFPGKTWATRTPAAAGLDAAKLAAFRDHVGGRGCVVRGGCMVTSWGDFTKRGDVASAAKPWYTHFLLLAVEKGVIKSLDSPVHEWDPRLKGKDRAITWHHLANQTSCYGVEERAGEAYDYSDYNMALLVDTLFLKAYKSSYARLDADVLHPRLTDRIGCQDGPTFLAFGGKDRPGRLGISARDFCRFGLLYLHKGRWDGKQLLGEKFAVRAVTSPLPNSIPRTGGKKAEMIAAQRSIGGGNNQTDHLGSYSFAWWTNGVDRDGKRHWPDAPLDTYAALGHGGRRAMVVIPSLDLVVSWNDAKLKGRDTENQALKLLVGAVKPR